MGVYINMLSSVLSFIWTNIVGLLNVLIAFLLVKEAKKMREVTTQPELVFYLKLVNQYTVIGRLENIGNGVAYNVSVSADNDFILFHDNNFNTAFDKIKSLAPKQYFDIQIDYLNINNEIMSLEKNALIKVLWTNTKKLNKSIYEYSMILDKLYFKNTPRIESLSNIAEAIKELERNLKR